MVQPCIRLFGIFVPLQKRKGGGHFGNRNHGFSVEILRFLHSVMYVFAFPNHSQLLLLFSFPAEDIDVPI